MSSSVLVQQETKYNCCRVKDGFSVFNFVNCVITISDMTYVNRMEELYKSVHKKSLITIHIVKQRQLCGNFGKSRY